MKSDRDFNSHYIGFVEKTYEISNYYSKKIKGENPIAINNYIKAKFKLLKNQGFNVYKIQKINYMSGSLRVFSSMNTNKKITIRGNKDPKKNSIKK